IEAPAGANHPQLGLLVEVIDVAPAGVPEDELMEPPLVSPAELLERPPVARRDRPDEVLVGRHRRPGGPLSYERASRDGARAEAVWFAAPRGVGRWGRGPALASEPREPVLRGRET